MLTFFSMWDQAMPSELGCSIFSASLNLGNTIRKDNFRQPSVFYTTGLFEIWNIQIYWIPTYFPTITLTMHKKKKNFTTLQLRAKIKQGPHSKFLRVWGSFLAPLLLLNNFLFNLFLFLQNSGGGGRPKALPAPLSLRVPC